MIPSEVEGMCNDMVAAGLDGKTALKLAWEFYDVMIESDEDAEILLAAPSYPDPQGALG